MTRYADPQKCPDCRGPIGFGIAACPACGLALRGDLAQQLFATLSNADQLLARLRAQPVTATEKAGTEPAPTAPTRSARTPGLSAVSVPRILLGLGALCLLVAALVFLAVTWSVLGVGGRTATLVGFTTVAGALTAWVSRRNLRAAAEALALVTLGLLALDVAGAENAGWLGGLDTPAFLAVLGTVVATAGGTGAVLARRTPVGVLTGAEVVCALGVGTMAVGIAATNRVPESPALVLAVLATGLSTALALLLGLRTASVGAGLATGLSWLGLMTGGLDRALRHDTVGELWIDLHVWPLLVAAGLVGGLALIPALPGQARLFSAMAGYAVLAVAVLVPAVAAPATEAALAVLAVLAVGGLVTLGATRPWGLVPVLGQALGTVWVLGLAAPSTAAALGRLAHAAGAGWSGQGAGRLPALAADPDLLAPWLLPLVVAVLAGVALALARATPGPWVRSLVDPRVGTAALAAAAVAMLALYPVPVWSVVATLLAVGLASGGWWLRGQAALDLPLPALLLLAGLLVGWYDEWLTAGALVVSLAAAVVVHLVAREADVGAAAGGVGAAVLAGLAWTTGALVGAPGTWTALVTLLLVALVALGLHRLPSRWWASPTPSVVRAGVEAGAVAAALPVGVAGVLVAPAGSGPTWAAAYLTVAGVATITQALARSDRRVLAWPGTLLLALASWVRLWDVGVREPEAYTLPSAVVLAVVGVLHLRRHPDAGTVAALGPALGLGLLPSLAWTLADPAGPRALLLGAACLALVLAGTRLRWTAPVVFGASAGGLLVLRLAAPYVGEAVPRWMLIGAAGALLIAVGVTWEKRLRDARQVAGYVRALR